MKSYLCTFVFHPFYNNYSYTNSLFNNFLLFQLNHNFGYIQRKSSHYACLSHIYSSTIIFFFTNLFQPRQGGVLDVLFFFFFPLSNATTNFHGSQKLMSHESYFSWPIQPQISHVLAPLIKRLYSFCFRCEIYAYASIVFEDIAITCSSHARRSIVHPTCHDTCHPLHILIIDGSDIVHMECKRSHN